MSSFDADPVVDSKGQKFVVKGPDDGDQLPEDNTFVARRVGADPIDCEESRRLTPEQIHDQAYAEGLEVGRAELPWSEAEELRSVIDALEKAGKELVSIRRDYLREERVVAVEVALAIAERLVRRHVEADLDALASVVERAAAALPESGALQLELSADDHAALMRGHAPDLEAWSLKTGVTVELGAELGRADVRVTAERGDVDARVESLLSRVREELAELYDVPEAEA